MIKVIKLVTGDDVVATVENVTGPAIGGGCGCSSKIVLKKPITLVPRQTPTGMTLGLAPWPMLVNRDTVDRVGIEIDTRNVVYMGDPDKELKEKYQQATSSLIIPETTLLQE